MANKKRATKRQIRGRRRAKEKRKSMYQNPVVECDFAEVETRVLAAMDQNKGFLKGGDLYGGYSIGSPERQAAKREHYLELYGNVDPRPTMRAVNEGEH